MKKLQSYSIILHYYTCHGQWSMARERERKKERKYSKGVEDLKKEGEGQKKMSKNAKKECRVLAKSNDRERTANKTK